MVKADTIRVKHLPDSVLEKQDNIYTDKNLSQAARDSIDKRRRLSYKRATLYSAVLPGAGQVYNKKYWKVPIVLAAVGIPAYLYFWNKSWYQKCQYALTVTVNGSPVDSVSKVDPQLLPLVLSGNTNAIITNRDSFRKDQDYSVLFFLLFYGLNIVDATVDAHLKDFNVSSDLSLRIKPMILPGPTPSAGITLAFDIHKPRPRTLCMN
jgi:Family of unknown function (DUF5683)